MFHLCLSKSHYFYHNYISISHLFTLKHYPYLPYLSSASLYLSSLLHIISFPNLITVTRFLFHYLYYIYYSTTFIIVLFSPVPYQYASLYSPSQPSIPISNLSTDLHHHLLSLIGISNHCIIPMNHNYYTPLFATTSYSHANPNSIFALLFNPFHPPPFYQ